MARPTGIEPVLRVPETLVISFSLRARGEIFSITVVEVSQRMVVVVARITCTISS